MKTFKNYPYKGDKIITGLKTWQMLKITDGKQNILVCFQSKNAKITKENMRVNHWINPNEKSINHENGHLWCVLIKGKTKKRVQKALVTEKIVKDEFKNAFGVELCSFGEIKQNKFLERIGFKAL